MSPEALLQFVHNLLESPVVTLVAPYVATLSWTLIAFLIAPIASANLFARVEYKRTVRLLAQAKDEAASPTTPCEKRVRPRCKAVLIGIAVFCLSYLLFSLLPKNFSAGYCWAVLLFLPRFFYVFFMLAYAVPIALAVRHDFFNALRSRKSVVALLLTLCMLASATIVSLALFTQIETFSWITFTATVIVCSLGNSRRRRSFDDILIRKFLLATSLLTSLVFAWTMTQVYSEAFGRVQKAFYELKGLDSWVLYWIQWVAPAAVAGMPGSVLALAHRFDRRIALDRLGMDEVYVEETSKDKSTSSVVVRKVDLGRFPRVYFNTGLLAWSFTQVVLVAIASTTGIRAYMSDAWIIFFSSPISVAVIVPAIAAVACNGGKHRGLSEYEEEWNWEKAARTREEIQKERADMEKVLLVKLEESGLI